MSNIVWKIRDFNQLSVKELYEILKIRQEVFVVEQTCYYLDTDGSDEMAIHIWAENKGQIVSYCRVFDANIKYKEASIGRVLTHPNFRRFGLGKTLMMIAIEIIKTIFLTELIRISAQDYLIEFYRSLGFQENGKKYLEDGIPHTEMEK